MPKNSVEESFTVALNSCSGKVWIRRGGILGISVEKFLSHSAERLPRGTLCCYINFGYLKCLDKRGGEIQILRRNFFLTVPKIYVGESFTNALISGSEKLWIGGGSIKIFRRLFLSHIAEGFRRRILYCCISFR